MGNSDNRRQEFFRFLNRPPAPTLARDSALRRAQRAILYLDEAMRLLGDEGASEAQVRAATRLADRAYEVTELRGGTLEKHAAMDFVDAIRWAAEDVLDRGVPLEYAVTPLSFGLRHPDLASNVDAPAFQRAVESWIASERSLRRRGRRIGRTPEKWPVVFAALSASRLGNGMKDAASVQKTWGKWSRARAGATRTAREE